VQIAAYCVSAFASGAMFYRWWRIGEEGRGRLWLLYGWFSGLMMFGSCIGALTWAAWMQVIVYLMIGNDNLNMDPLQSRSHFALYNALSRSWRAAFSVTYAIEFLCLSVTKLMVLDRMSNFAALQTSGLWRRWVVCRKVVMAAVVAGNLVGLAGNIAAAVHFQHAAELYMSSHADFAANRSVGEQTFRQGQYQNRLGLSMASVQSFCEVAVLLLIVLSFAVVGVACARRVSSALMRLEAGAEMADGMQLRRQIAATFGVIFVTFLLRSVYSTLYAVAYQLQDLDSPCPGNTQSFCNAACFNVFAHIVRWNFLTPEFQLTIVLISSPLALLVALWGMTSKSMRSRMQHRHREMRL
jgi:hypothetical protein